MDLPIRRNDKVYMDKEELVVHDIEGRPLWELEIEELEGHNLEVKGREEVNQMLREGWILLHIYTLKYREDDVWREKPMAILGRPKPSKKGYRSPAGRIAGDI